MHTDHQSKDAQGEEEVKWLEVHDCVEHNSEHSTTQSQGQSAIHIFQVFTNVFLARIIFK